MLISITIPVYNDAEGLKVSLNSLIKQTYTNWEAIIVDDGSITNVEHIVKEFKDDRLKFYRLEKNMGRPIARQKTFKHIQGQYIGFLDAGDTYTIDFLSNIIRVLKVSNILGVSQSMTVNYKNISYLSNYQDECIDIASTKYNHISFASTVFKSEVCKDYKFDPTLRFSQDRHFLDFISVNFKGEICLINSHSYNYNQGDKMKVSTLFKKYYFSAKRLFNERKYIKATRTLMKMIVFPLIQIVFGYEVILNLRYEKQVNKSL